MKICGANDSGAMSQRDEKFSEKGGKPGQGNGTGKRFEDACCNCAKYEHTVRQKVEEETDSEEKAMGME